MAQLRRLRPLRDLFFQKYKGIFRDNRNARQRQQPFHRAPGTGKVFVFGSSLFERTRQAGVERQIARKLLRQFFLLLKRFSRSDFEVSFTQMAGSIVPGEPLHPAACASSGLCLLLRPGSRKEGLPGARSPAECPGPDSPASDWQTRPS